VQPQCVHNALFWVLYEFVANNYSMAPACFPARWCELATPLGLDVRRGSRPFQLLSYPTRTHSRRCFPYPHGPYRPAAKISTPDYIGTGDSHDPTPSQSNRLIIPLTGRPDGNRTGELRVWVYLWLGLHCTSDPSCGYTDTRSLKVYYVNYN